MVGTKIRSQAFAVRDEMVSAGDYGSAMVIICDGEVVVHHVNRSKMHSYYYHARVASWNEGAPPLLPMRRPIHGKNGDGTAAPPRAVCCTKRTTAQPVQTVSEWQQRQVRYSNTP